MPRRKPFSAKQKKVQMQDKRAVKRGDLDASEVRIPSHPTRPSRPSRRPGPGGGSSGVGIEGTSGLSSTRLQSKFIALTPAYLASTRDLAYSYPLPRPIPATNAVFPIEVMRRDNGELTCPARPKFRYDMTKKEVEKNEEGVFARWLNTTETVVKTYVAKAAQAAEERAVAEEENERMGGEVGVNEDEGVDGEGTIIGQREGVDAEQEEGAALLRSMQSPTWFETNLEVWRQLWRVTESSQILLLLLDARCPPLHLPTSLRTYVQSLKPRKEVILILTKSDLVDPQALEGWKAWVKGWWAEGLREREQAKKERERSGRVKRDDKALDAGQEAGVQVVGVRSYDTDLLYADKARHRPDLPSDALRELVSALRSAHDRLRTPHHRTASDPEKLAKWTSPVRQEVDWELLSHGPAAAYPPVGVKMPVVGAGIADEPLPEIGDSDDEEGSGSESESGGSGAGHASQSPLDGSRKKQNEDPAHQDHQPQQTPSETHTRTLRDANLEPLTLGLIGQPNVGKSSLLNALMGESRVRASKTPGKTKHFQTLFWGWKRQVKIVDCPGLVCPSLVGLEIQALCGILPISQIPSLPACITTAAALLPLEEIFRVPPPPSEQVDAYAHKKTWRGGMGPKIEVESKQKWTAGEIMEGRALDRGYITAKGGRPDGNRAANAMMRALAEGKIRWCFFPPRLASTRSDNDHADDNIDTAAASQVQTQGSRDGMGIWLGDFARDDVEVEGDEEDGEEDDEDGEGDGDGDRRGKGRGDADTDGAEDNSDEGSSEDDGEVEEVERKVKEIDRGFFAALDVGEGEGSEGSEDSEESKDSADDEDSEGDEGGKKA